MKSASTHFKMLAAAAALLCGSVVLGAGIAGTRWTADEPAWGLETDRNQAEHTEIDVTRLFPDAPHGVDPVVTGPVSASFRQQQAEAGCDKAVWPKIPAACYPN